MSPRAALESEIFRTYAIILVTLIVVAGAGVLIARWKAGDAARHATKAYLGWLSVV